MSGDHGMYFKCALTVEKLHLKQKLCFLLTFSNIDNKSSKQYFDYLPLYLDIY